MLNRKYLIILSILVVISFFFFIRSIQTGYFIIPSVRTESEIKSTLEDLSKEEKGEINLDFKKSNTCYWIRPTVNETNYLIEITEYETSANTKGCMGLPKGKKYIVVDKPINLQGNDCVCGNLKHLLKIKNIGNTKQLEIS
jgi:hypothetical protein